ncbi:MAG: sporulation protein YunB [Clostridia bacterium]|nr:sporulation protein YunB [Clostridia bacterium]
MKPRKRRRKRHVLVLMLALMLVVVGVVAVDSQLRPLVQSYGQMSARQRAMMAVHAGMEKALSSQMPQYSDLVKVERATDGRVLSAEANVSAINRLKAAATTAVTEELQKRESEKIRIPLGNLIGGSFFTGRGPFLPITIHTGGAVISELSDDFRDAGINQTNHRLSLDVTVMMTAALPLERVSIDVKTDFLICETVLVGDVPQTMLQLDFGEKMRDSD